MEPSFRLLKTLRKIAYFTPSNPISDAYIEEICRVMLEADWHTYQAPTKRADCMADLLKGKLRRAAKAQRIWWGVSVEKKSRVCPE
jgi:protein gp37